MVFGAVEFFLGRLEGVFHRKVRSSSNILLMTLNLGVKKEDVKASSCDPQKIEKLLLSVSAQVAYLEQKSINYKSYLSILRVLGDASVHRLLPPSNQGCELDALPSGFVSRLHVSVFETWKIRRSTL